MSGGLRMTDCNRSFFVDREQALRLELSLNKSARGHQWSNIGQELFDYHTKKNEFIIVIILTEEQYDTLLAFRNRRRYSS
jgi:hypothetical protein